jgi:hypothetical protein
MSMSAAEIEEFLKRSRTPIGYKYALVLASITKRVLQSAMPEEYRLKFLQHLDLMSQGEQCLTADMIAAVEPMDDRGEELAREVRKVGPNKALDVYADMFAIFAALNPSLVEALKKSPSYRYATHSA